MWTMKGDSRGERIQRKAAMRKAKKRLWTQGQLNVAAAMSGGKATFNGSMAPQQSGNVYISLHTSMPPKEVEELNGYMRKQTQPEPPPELQRAMSNRQATAGWKEEP